jgi:1-acyl-sn-glycerol-3-phosphate acyltransferase
MSYLRSLLFFIFFYVISAFLAILALVETLIAPSHVIWVSRRWALWHRFCARYLLGISSKVIGTLPQGAALVAIKHESNFETFELLVLFDRPAVVMKKELVDIPVWGTVARRHGVIPVDRNSGSAALRQMLKAAKAAIADNRPIILFPEGTRTPPGSQPPLRAGMAGLYKALNLPIVPVALQSGRLCPRKGLVRHKGVVTWLVGETIPAGLPREEMEARVHKAINAQNT